MTGLSAVASSELVGEKVTLVPFGEQHLGEHYVSWLNDPEVVVYSELRHRREDLASCRRYLDSMRAAGNPFWAIISRLDGQRHVGNLTAYVDSPNCTANLAILVGESCARGKGMGAEAWKLACDVLLAQGGLRKVYGRTMAANAPMLGVMRATGMVEEGRVPRHFVLDGAEVDLVVMARYA